MTYVGYVAVSNLCSGGKEFEYHLSVLRVVFWFLSLFTYCDRLLTYPYLLTICDSPDHLILHYIIYMPTPVAARSMAWVCGRSLAGILGSNPAGDMDVCLL
jgi:hypothetical protein